MKLQKLLILAIIILSLIPAYYINRWMLNWIQPRRSFLQFLLYMLLSFALIFLYTFLLVMIISAVFPQAKV